MKWIEIITLRSPTKIDKQFVDELLEEVAESDSPSHTPNHLIEIKIYQHSVVETDLSIHIHWKSEPGSQDKTPLGLRFFSALRNLGLVNHSVWVEKGALEFALMNGSSKSLASHKKENTIQTGPQVAQKVRF